MKRLISLFVISFFAVAVIFAQLKYALIPENPRPGEPITIGVSSGVREAVLIVNGRREGRSPFFFVPAERGNPGFLAAVITIPSLVSANNAVIRLNNERGMVMEIPIVIASRTFEAEVIPLNPVNTGIRTDPSPQRMEEARLLQSILNTTGNQIYHTGPFLPPVISTRRTSHFGDRRVFQYSTGGSDTSIHAGVDYGVPRGTRIYACGAGRVVLARMRIVTGNSVIIEHAPGIYSLYYHLDRIDVREGDIIRVGVQIGLSGSTGLSTGPHLHWEVRVNNENTDPDAFVHRQIIDKDQLIHKMYN